MNFEEIIFGGVLPSIEIETLHNVTSFSKLSHEHFSANITKISEQLPSKLFSNFIVNSQIRTHVKLDNILL